MLLHEAAKILNAELLNVGAKSEANKINNISFANLAIDSRAIKSEDQALFVAIKGKKVDGHDFIAKAKEAGALAALVEECLPDGVLACGLPLLKVSNTILALGKLGAWKRQQFQGKIFAVTGSCGKTTARQLLANILNQCDKTLSSIKSFNNDIGVPLTLWQLMSEHRYAVLEVGANAHGEISYLTNLIKPHVAIITNAAPCHLEGFGNLAGVAQAKGEIFQGLSPNGIAILNADDQFYNYWQDLIMEREAKTKNKIKIFTFGGMSDERENQGKVDVDVTVRDLRFNENNKYAAFTLCSPQGVVEINLPLLGKHNVMNAVLAATAALAVGISFDAIKSGLEISAAVNRRLVIKKGYRGAKIIDDSYNSNPTAMKAALEVLAKEDRIKILVCGDMRELGEEAKNWHACVGRWARESGIDEVYAYGEFAEAVVEAFRGKSKISSDNKNQKAYAFLDKQKLIAALQNAISKNCEENSVVLVKGSFSMGMDEVVDALMVKN